MSVIVSASSGQSYRLILVEDTDFLRLHPGCPGQGGGGGGGGAVM